MQKQPSDLVSVPEAAEKLSIGASTIRLWQRKGEVAKYKQGWRVYCSLKDVQKRVSPPVKRVS